MTRRATAFFVTVGMALFCATPVVAQTGIVTGVVRDATTSQPISSAQVQIVGSGLGGLAGATGNYRIQNVPAGQVQVRAIVLGYAEQTLSADVRPGQTTQLNFSLAPQAIALDQIVVTATGEQRKRQLSNAVSGIDAAEVTQTAPVKTFSDLLTGRASGVQVVGSSGTTGAGTRIRIRGASSISLSNEPVIYIDGVRIESGAESSSIGVGGQEPSRLSELNPEDIESVEIVKGPSAATLYGTDAANGVIRITTKRGRVGETSLSAWTEYGVLRDRNDYPSNYQGFDAGGDSCYAFLVGLGACTQSRLQSFNPLEDALSSPFKDGRRVQYGAALSGGSETLTYYVSAEWEEEDGVFGLPAFEQQNLRDQFGSAYADLPESQFNPNTLDKLSLRANFGGKVAEDVNLRVTTGYVSSDLNLPQNDNNVLGIIPSAYLGGFEGTEADNYGYGFFLPSEVYALSVAQEVERFTGGAEITWEPLAWLSSRANVGLDVVNRTDVQNVPRERVFFGATLPLGIRDVNSARIYNYTIDANATARFDLNPQWTSRTTVGTQYFRDRFTRADAHGEDIVAGASSITAAAITEADENTAESITLGAFIEQEFGFRDNVFITGAVRGDDNSAFGKEFDFVVYPKLGASWVVSDEEFFPRGDYLNSLRLRAAWGKSGTQPGPTDALRFFTPRAVTADDEDVTGVSFEDLGNASLEPEQSQEFEVGFDASFLRERIGLEFTYYDKTTNDLLIETPLPPSGGVGELRFANLGQVKNTGFEAGINAQLVQTDMVRWDLGLLGSTNDNELRDLGTLPSGEPIPPIIQGAQRFVEGYPLGGFWAQPMTFADDGDGVIVPSEVTVGPDAEFIGSALPTKELSLTTSLTLWNRLRLNGLLNYQGGHYQRNLTEFFRCQFAICQGLNDTNASGLSQARAVTAAALPAAQRSEFAFIEKADFWKLRELGATFFVPEEYSRRVGVERSSITLSGRNLFTWTDYTGADPEVNQFGQDNFLTRDFLTQPPVTYWTVRVNLNF